MKKLNKKGFTTVELVIVIAVIAILAAVLIPTFAGIISKANESADETAVRNMNNILAMDGVTEPTDIYELFDVLAENGIKADDYTPLYKDRYFFWDSEENVVVYTDANYNILYPAKTEGLDKANWITLNGKLNIDAVKVNSLLNEAKDTATAKTAEELLAIVNAINEGKLKNVTTIALENKVYNLMGAELIIANNYTSDGLSTLTKSLTINGNGATIANVVNINAALTEVVHDHGGTHSRDYASAIIPKVSGSGVELKISGLTIDGGYFGNDLVTGAAAIVGLVGDGATATFENVDIKNVEVRALYKVGAFVGQVHGGALKIDAESSVSDTDIIVSGGLAGKIFGVALNITPDVSATVENVKVTLVKNSAIKYTTVANVEYAQDLEVENGAVVANADEKNYFATVADYGFVGTYGNNTVIDAESGIKNKYTVTAYTPASN